MNNKNTPYIRVGTKFYKRIIIPLASGDEMDELKTWDRTAIREDHPSDYYNLVRDQIPKYDSFCLIPDHINYKREIRKSYNIYEPIPHKSIKGNFNVTEEFLTGIFNEQYQIGLDYLKIIYLHPTKILPILCLVSSERHTGKTTFLNWLKMIFGKNMTINTNEDFRNQFNSGWTCKLIIGVDEVLLDKKEDSERIKNLSTTKTIKTEAKGKDKIEGEFFGKFILCSNNEEEFIKIDSDEIRYWIRRVPPYQKEISNLDVKLKSEIPAFLYFLETKEYFTTNKTRMWFTPEQIYTNALDKVKCNSVPLLEKELRSQINDYLIQFNLNEAKLTPKDLRNLLKDQGGLTTNTGEITKILSKWHLIPKGNALSYQRYHYHPDGHDEISFNQTCKGRYYTFKKNDKYLLNKS